MEIKLDIKKVALLLLLCSASQCLHASDDKQAIRQAALDYIESQHHVNPAQMKRSLHKQLKKRTYWRKGNQPESLMETSYEFMVRLAGFYNKNGDKFPKSPKKEVDILDIDGRVASVKLTVDDWIDYMHLIKTEGGEWKIVNVLWQYHDQTKHSSD